MRSVERWLLAVPLLAASHLVLMALLHARLGLAGVILWHVGPLTLTIGAIAVMLYGLLRSRRSRLTWTRGRAAGYVGLLVIAAMPLAYRTYPSSRDHHPSQVPFRLPLDGPITVAWGGPTRDVNYHVIAPAERWAYDLMVNPDQRRYRTDGRIVEDYYTYGSPVLAPAAGTVRDVADHQPDTRIGGVFVGARPCGNSIVMEVAPGEFLFLCHLQARSITVRPGEQVRAGQPLARVGNSGRTTEPHLHVHLQSTPRFDLGEGIPLYFHRYRDGPRVIDRGMPTGGKRPQVVEHAAASGGVWQPLLDPDAAR